MIKLYGTPPHALNASGDVPNFDSPKIVKEHAIRLEGSSRVATVADGSRLDVLGKLKDVPVVIGGAIFHMELFDHLGHDSGARAFRSSSRRYFY